MKTYLEIVNGEESSSESESGEFSSSASDSEAQIGKRRVHTATTAALPHQEETQAQLPKAEASRHKRACCWTKVLALTKNSNGTIVLKPSTRKRLAEEINRSEESPAEETGSPPEKRSAHQRQPETQWCFSNERPGEPQVRKRERTRFSGDEQESLLNFFKNTPHPDSEQKARFAEQSGIPLKVVSTWLNNYRRRNKPPSEADTNTPQAAMGSSRN